MSPREGKPSSRRTSLSCCADLHSGQARSRTEKGEHLTSCYKATDLCFIPCPATLNKRDKWAWPVPLVAILGFQEKHRCPETGEGQAPHFLLYLHRRTAHQCPREEQANGTMQNRAAGSRSSHLDLALKGRPLLWPERPKRLRSSQEGLWRCRHGKSTGGGAPIACPLQSPGQLRGYIQPVPRRHEQSRSAPCPTP